MCNSCTQQRSRIGHVRWSLNDFLFVLPYSLRDCSATTRNAVKGKRKRRKLNIKFDLKGAQKCGVPIISKIELV